MSRQVANFDPSATTPGPIPTGTHSDYGISFLNESNIGINLIIGDGSQIAVPAYYLLSVHICYISDSFEWAVSYVVPSPSAVPISLAIVTIYQPSELQNMPPSGPLNRLTNVGNSIPIVTTVAANQVTSGTFQAGVLEPAAQVAAGTFGAGVLLPAAQLSGTINPATQIGAGTFAAGILLPAPQVAGGTFGAGVFLPAAQVSAGTFPAGVLLPTSQLTGKINPATQVATGTFAAGILLPAAQVSAGTFGGGVLLPAAQITGTITATSIPAAGVQDGSLDTGVVMGPSATEQIGYGAGGDAGPGIVTATDNAWLFSAGGQGTGIGWNIYYDGSNYRYLKNGAAYLLLFGNSATVTLHEYNSGTAGNIVSQAQQGGLFRSKSAGGGAAGNANWIGTSDPGGSASEGDTWDNV